MSREVSDWLDGYLKYTENSEPPTSYHTWCGLSLIAGALQRKVYLNWGFERIHPNLFAVLVGPSGKARKGVALGIAKDMLSRISTVSIAPEASSREAIILAMKRAMANYTDPTDNKVKLHCSLTAFSEELAVFLGQSDIKLLANLTDWYDSKDAWSYETIGRGRDSLEGLCFNLMGATAPDWLQSMLPQEAVGGGFTSRVIFVVEEKKGKTVPKHELTPAEISLQEKLSRDLERINKLSGEAHFSPDGEKAYVDWYEEQDRLLAQGKLAVDDSRFAGYCERRATHIRKLMLLCSAGRGDSLVIEQADFRKALGILVATERKMHWTFGGLGKAKYSNITDQVIRYIQQMGCCTRSTLLAKFYRDLDTFTLREVEATMEQMKVVEISMLLNKGDKMYKWIPTGGSNGDEK